jgi:hypothetical protein
MAEGWGDEFESAAVHEPSWEERHREMARDRRRAQWAARRKRLFSLRTLAIAALVVAGVGYLVQPKRNGPARVAAGKSDPTGSTSSTIRLENRDYQVGDCVIWEEDRPTTAPRITRVVPCEDPHLIEVAGRVPLDGAAYPSPAEWESLIDRHCPRLMATLLNGPFDPEGRFAVSALIPLAEGWSRGFQRMWCGARSAIGPAGFLGGPFTGRARASEQALTLAMPVGSCEILERRGPVPCDQPHGWEVVAHMDLGDVQTPPGPGDVAGWNALLGDRCQKAAVAYLGHPLRGDLGVAWHEIRPTSWAAGTRLTRCLVAHYASHDKKAVITTTGSVRGQ